MLDRTNPAAFEPRHFLERSVEPHLEGFSGNTRQNLAVAVALAQAGCYIFPTVDKVPIVAEYAKADTEITTETTEKARSRWQARHSGDDPPHIGATRDVEVLKRLWQRFPDATPSISTGPSGLVVFDPDRKNDGPTKFGNFMRQHGGVPKNAAVTKTQDGGRHVYFKNNANLRGQPKLFKTLYGCDVKGVGGQVVAPGAIRGDGKRYEPDGRYASLFQAMITDTLPAIPAALVDEVKRCGGGAAQEDDPLALPPKLAREPRPVQPWLRSALAAIPNEDIDYDQWVKIGAAIHHETGGSAEGRELFEEWSTTNGKHDDDKFDKTWTSYGETYGGRPVTGRTIDALAREHGWLPAGIGAADEAEDDTTDFKPFSRGLTDRPFDAIPARPIVLAGMLQRGKVSGLTGPGGSFKSTYGLQVALAVVTGRAEIACLPVGAVIEPTCVGYLNAEDDADEIDRRLTAIREHFGVAYSEINGRLFVQSGIGPDGELRLTKRTPAGALKVNKSAVDMIVKSIEELSLGVVIIDPMIEFHAGVETNEELHVFTTALRTIAERSGVAVLLSTHTSKLSVAASDSYHGNASAQRGGTGLGNAMRTLLTMFAMSKREAADYAVPEDEARFYVRLEGAKANYAELLGGIWFKRHVVGSGPERSVALLLPADLQKRGKASKLKAAARHNTLLSEIAAIAQERQAKGQAITDVVVRNDAEAKARLIDATGVSAPTLARRLEALVERGDLVLVPQERKTGALGYRLAEEPVCDPGADHEDAIYRTDESD